METGISISRSVKLRWQTMLLDFTLSYERVSSLLQREEWYSPCREWIMYLRENRFNETHYKLLLT
jgi:hypothetical protein